MLLGGCRHEGPAPVTTTCGDSGHAVYAGFSDPRLPTFSARVRTEIGGGFREGRPVPFGRIASIAADPTHVYTLDALNQAVFVHTLAGRFITGFGRKGARPGEFIQPVAIGFVEPDSIFVFDVDSWRLSVFSVRGRLLRTQTVGRTEPFGPVFEVRFGPHGEIYQLGYGKYQASLSDALGPRQSGAVRGTNTLERWDAASRTWLELADVPGLEVYAERGGGGIEDVPFAARALWAPVHDGLWYADNETYTLTRYSQSGEKRCDVHVVHTNPSVSESERAAFYNAADLSGDPRLEGRLASIRQARTHIPVPATKPDLTALVVSSEGNLWIRVPMPDGDAGHPNGQAAWQVFDADGRPIGSGTFPSGFRPVLIRHDEVIGVLTDSLGIDRVGMLAVSWRG